MNTILDFIKNFHPSDFGLDGWDMMIILGLTLAGLILINWIVSFLPERTGNLIKAIVKHFFNVVYYGGVVFISLNAILTGNYTYVLILALFTLFSKVDYLYKLYDDFVDRKIK